jgi:hypothetical protein
MKLKLSTQVTTRLPWALLGLTVLFSIVAAAVGIPADLLWVYTVFIMFSPVGTVIALRRPENSIGWLYCIIGLSTAIGASLSAVIADLLGAGSTNALAVAWLSLGELLIGTVIWVGMFVSLMLFPTGRFLSRRWALVGLALVVAFMSGALLTIISSPHLLGTPLDNPFRIEWLAGPAYAASGLFGAMGFIALGLGLISVVLRFVRSRGDERLQFKWFAFSVSLLIVVAPVFFFRGQIWGDGDTLPLQVILAIENILIAAVPVSVAVAILKYRLYDIDVIIRRTLVYSVLTATLAALYWGGVASLQALLRPITGEGNDLAIVATTLAVAALSLPLRRGIQGFIDRRFYRRKYDAAKTIAAFGDHVRDEVELDKLTARLVEVVDETMQPEHVALWLRETAAGSPRVTNQGGQA